MASPNNSGPLSPPLMSTNPAPDATETETPTTNGQKTLKVNKGKRSLSDEPTAGETTSPQESDEDYNQPAKKKVKLEGLPGDGAPPQAGMAVDNAAESEGAALLMSFADVLAHALPILVKDTASEGENVSARVAAGRAPSSGLSPPSSGLLSSNTTSNPSSLSSSLSTLSSSTAQGPPHSQATNVALHFASSASAPHLLQLQDLPPGLPHAALPPNNSLQALPNTLTQGDPPKQRKARKITPPLDPRAASASLASTGHSTMNIAGLLQSQATPLPSHTSSNLASAHLPLPGPPGNLLQTNGSPFPTSGLSAGLGAALAQPKPPSTLANPTKPSLSHLNLDSHSDRFTVAAASRLKRCATHVKIALSIVQQQQQAAPLAGNKTQTSLPSLSQAASNGSQPTSAEALSLNGSQSSASGIATPSVIASRPAPHNALSALTQPQPIAKPSMAAPGLPIVDHATIDALLSLSPMHLQQLAQQGNPIALAILQQQTQQQLNMLAAGHQMAGGAIPSPLYAQMLGRPGVNPAMLPQGASMAQMQQWQQLYLQQQQQQQAQQQQQYQAMQVYQLQLFHAQQQAQQQAQLQQLRLQQHQQQLIQQQNAALNSVASLKDALRQPSNQLPMSLLKPEESVGTSTPIKAESKSNAVSPTTTQLKALGSATAEITPVAGNDSLASTLAALASASSTTDTPNMPRTENGASVPVATLPQTATPVGTSPEKHSEKVNGVDSVPAAVGLPLSPQTHLVPVP